MGKALGIDYGTKRTGIAITDEMQIIASGLTTIATHNLDDLLLKSGGSSIKKTPFGNSILKDLAIEILTKEKLKHFHLDDE